MKLALHTQIFIGMIAGVLFGIFFPAHVHWVTPVGKIFIQLLKLLVVPLIFLSVIDGFNKVGSAKKLSELGLKTTIFYLTTNFLAVFTSLVLVNLIRPGDGVKIFGSEAPAHAAGINTMNFIPSNIVQSFAQADTLQVVFLAILFGSAMVALKDQIPHLKAGFAEATEVLLTLTGAFVKLAPIGVFGLLAGMVHAIDWPTFIGIGKFAAVIITGLIIHGCVTLPVFFKIFSDRPLLPFVKMMEPALLTSFSTSSSSATLPVTMECIEKKAKISKEVAGFVLPIGATLNMDGTAIYEAAACLFVAQAVGLDLSLSQQLIVFFMSALAAIGAASIPSAGLVTLALVLSAVGLPLDGIAFLMAIDRPLDMSRTIVNVWGDMVGCVVVEGKGKQKNSAS